MSLRDIIATAETEHQFGTISGLHLMAIVTVCSAARQGEPVFVIRAQDTAAPSAVEAWVEVAMAESALGVPPAVKLADARAIAGSMHRWQRNNPGRVKVAD